MPTLAATNEKNEKTSRDKFITCAFIAGVDAKNGKLKMNILVENQKEHEPEEPVMPDKEEAKSPFVMKTMMVSHYSNRAT